MKIQADEPATLNAQPLPLIALIHGDEPQLNLDALQNLRDKARHLGFLERTVHFSDAFQWSELLLARQSSSLFAQKKVFELHIVEEKLSKNASNIVLQLCTPSSVEETFFLLYAPNLDKPDALAYYKALCQQQLVVHSKKLYPRAFQQQLQQRLQQAGLHLEPDAFHRFQQCYEGNLLAAQQAIHRLQAMPHAEHRFNINDLMPVLSDQAQFNLFSLSDALLLGQWQRALSIAQRFAQEGDAKIPMILNAQWQKDTTLLLALHADPQPAQQQKLFQQYKIPNFKQRMYQDALKQQGIARLRATVKVLARLDLTLKGASHGDYWHQLHQYLLHCIAK